MTGVIYASRIGARTTLAILQTSKPPHLAQTRKSPERPRCAESPTRAAWALRFVGGVLRGNVSGVAVGGAWYVVVGGCVVVGVCAVVSVCAAVGVCVAVGVPRVWSPLQGCAPWALEGVAPIGACVAVGGLQWLGFVRRLRVVWWLRVVRRFGFPRVWSPFQGCSPWALGRVAPIGACVAVGACVVVGACAVIGDVRRLGVVWRLVFPGFGRPCRAAHPGLWRGSPLQGLTRRLGLVRLSRVVWSLGVVRRLGLCGGWCSQGLVALSGLRTLGFGEGRPYRGLRSHPRRVLILVSPWRGINPSSCPQAEMSAPRQRYVVRQRVRGLLL